MILYCSQYLIREVTVTAIFSMSLLVVPALLRINDLPRWGTGFLLYPLYNYAVDSSGTGSSFSPNVLLATGLLASSEGGDDEYLLSVGLRMGASVLGGLVGGKIMQRYFPD